MAGITAASSLTATLKTQAFAGLQDAVFYNNEVMPLFGPPVDMTGGATWNGKIHYSSNSSPVRYNEGDPVGASGSENYTTFSWTPVYYRDSLSITGHALDQMRNGAPEAVFFDQFSEDLARLMKKCVDLASTDMLGTTYGLEGIIDDSGTVGGLSASTYTWWASNENAAAAGGTIAMTDMNILWAETHDAEYAASINLILTTWTVVRKIHGLTVPLTASTYQGTANQQSLDVGMNYGSGFAFSGAPVKPIRDLTSASMYMLTTEHIKVVRMRDWRIELLAKTDDSEKYMLTGAWCIATTNRRKHGKLTSA